MTCMIRFTSYLSKVGGSLRTLASHTTKTGHHNIAENCCTDIKPYERNKQLDSVFQEILLVCQHIWCTMYLLSFLRSRLKRGHHLKLQRDHRTENEMSHKLFIVYHSDTVPSTITVSMWYWYMYMYTCSNFKFISLMGAKDLSMQCTKMPFVHLDGPLIGVMRHLEFYSFWTVPFSSQLQYKPKQYLESEKTHLWSSVNNLESLVAY